MHYNQPLLLENPIMEPILYLMMRSDLPDFNPGKLAAQAAHVASEFENWTRCVEEQSDVLDSIKQWRKQAGTCGTTICLIATDDEISSSLIEFDYGGDFIDPSYPWRNWWGDLQLTAFRTGAWFFVCDQNHYDLEFLKKFDLHP